MATITTPDIREEVATASSRDATPLLKGALWVLAVDQLLFGALFGFAPGYAVETLAGIEPFPYLMVRYSGFLLLGLAFGTFMLLQDARGQMKLFTTLLLACAVSGLGLVLGWMAGDYEGATWLILAGLVATIGVAGLMLWARIKAHDFLAG